MARCNRDLWRAYSSDGDEAPAAAFEQITQSCVSHRTVSTQHGNRRFAAGKPFLFFMSKRRDGAAHAASQRNAFAQRQRDWR
jgi:hypothetical protein